MRILDLLPRHLDEISEESARVIPDRSFQSLISLELKRGGVTSSCNASHSCTTFDKFRLCRLLL